MSGDGRGERRGRRRMYDVMWCGVVFVEERVRWNCIF